MTATWDWVAPLRDKHFGPPLAGKYALEPLARAAYWPLHEKDMRRHFPEEVFFNFWAPFTGEEKRDRERLSAGMAAQPLEDFWVARDREQVVMMACGHQVDDRVYRMWHTHVHPAYRGKGLYGEYLRRLLAYTKDVGFRAVKSEHAPSNNAVLIAKLKAGFRLYAWELDAAVGASVVLRYFHDPAELAAYEYRCGQATITPELLARGAGAAKQLAAQFRAAPEGPSSPAE